MHESAKPIASPDCAVVGDELGKQAAQPERRHAGQDRMAQGVGTKQSVGAKKRCRATKQYDQSNKKVVHEKDAPRQQRDACQLLFPSKEAIEKDVAQAQQHE